MKITFLSIIICLTANLGSSQTTYIFNGNGNWSDSSNWLNKAIPPNPSTNGSTIYISPTSGNTCTLDVSQTILQGTNLIVSVGANFRIAGGLNVNIQASPLTRKYVSKILITNLSTNKTTRILEWKYDNLKRCLEATERSISPPLSNPGDTVLERKYIFYYNNDELLPYRIYAPPHVRIENLANDVYIKYLADGKKYLDSCIYTDPSSGSYLKTVNYKYEDQIIYATFKQTNISWTGSSVVFGTGYDTVYISNNNIPKVIQANPSNTTVNGVGLYQYDDKINPFNQLNIASSFYLLGPSYHYSKWFFWNDVYDLLAIIGGNKNNITQKSEYWNSNTMMSFSYIYDQDNYPTSIQISGESYATLRLDVEYIN